MYKNPEFERIRLEHEAKQREKDNEWARFFVKEIRQIQSHYVGRHANPRNLAALAGEGHRLWDIAVREQQEPALERAIKFTSARFL